MLVKKSLCSNFDVTILDKTQRDILWIKFSNKNDVVLLFLICCCYLPPENSTRIISSQQLFDSLTTQVCSYSDHLLLICGDINARIDEKQDVALDNVPRRFAENHCINCFEEYFLDFLQDCGLCVLNGRGFIDRIILRVFPVWASVWLTTCVFLIRMCHIVLDLGL